jgi:VanZ family protein
MKSRSLWQLFKFLYAAFFLVTLVLAYTGKLHIPLAQPPYDKAGHLILYGTATFLGHRILGYRRLRRLPLFPLLFGIFTIAEELFQSLSPNRTLDAVDLIFSFLGIGLGYWLAERSR